MTSVKTFAMQAVFPYSHADPFFKVKSALMRAYPLFCRWSYAITNHLFWWLGLTTSNMVKFLVEICYDLCYAPHMGLTAMSVNFLVQTSNEPRIPPILPMIICYSSPCLLVIWITDIKNTKIFRGHQIGPWLCIRLALMAMPANFQGKTSLEVRISPFFWWSCSIFYYLYWWSKFLTSTIQKFLVGDR